MSRRVELFGGVGPALGGWGWSQGYVTQGWAEGLRHSGAGPTQGGRGAGCV